MKLTPLEIRKQEFRKSIRGLDQVEVQTFLEMVAEQYEALLEENKALNRRIIELETKLHNFQESEKTLRETLLNVQEVKKQSEESSRRKADLVIKEAELKAAEILDSTRKESRQIREEIGWLKSQKESFINRLRHILVSQVELLSVMEIDDVLPEESKKILNKSGASISSSKRKSKPDNTPLENLTPKLDVGLDQSSEQAKKSAAPDEKITEEEERIIKLLRDEEFKKNDLDKNSPQKDTSLTEEDINDFFKKGLEIDDLIKTINKKDVGK